MAKGQKILKNIFSPTDKVEQAFTIESWHVSQSVEAFTGAENYDITVSGSLTISGSLYHEDVRVATGPGYNVLLRSAATGEYFITSSYDNVTSGTSGYSGTSG